MELSDIMECAETVLGVSLTPGQAQTLERCCASARASCLARLRGTLTEAVYPVVLQACGTLAAGLFLEQTEGDEVASFTAGKLSVTTRGGSRSRNLKALAMELLAPYASDGFAFLGVRG